jgi:hypothetical protein
MIRVGLDIEKHLACGLDWRILWREGRDRARMEASRCFDMIARGNKTQ